MRKAQTIPELSVQLADMQKKMDDDHCKHDARLDTLVELQNAKMAAKTITALGSVTGLGSFVFGIIDQNVGLMFVGLGVGLPALVGCWQLRHD